MGREKPDKRYLQQIQQIEVKNRKCNKKGKA